MKAEKLVKSIVVVLLLIIVVSGGSYAYFLLTVSSNNAIKGNSEKYDIVYSGGTTIDGQIRMADDHTGGYNTTVSIATAQGVTIDVNATIYLVIEEISEAVAISAFKWEVYSVSNNVETYVNSGDFDGTEDDDEVVLVTNYQISTTPTQFKVYFWLDGDDVNTDITGATFRGYIGARTDQITGIVDNS